MQVQQLPPLVNLAVCNLYVLCESTWYDREKYRGSQPSAYLTGVARSASSLEIHLCPSQS